MSLRSKIRAVVFDMDGLIFDTEALYRDAIMAVASEGGHDMPLSFYLSTIGLTGTDTRTVFRERYGPAFDFDAFWKMASDRFHEMAKVQLRLKPGVVELLDVLDAASLPRAIATSSWHEDVRIHLNAHDLRDRFHAVVAHGDYARGKPNPDPYLKAAERLGIAPGSCLALEDSYNGVRAASGAGMTTIMVPDLLAATAEMEELCLHVVPDLHHVRALIEA